MATISRQSELTSNDTTALKSSTCPLIEYVEPSLVRLIEPLRLSKYDYTKI